MLAILLLLQAGPSSGAAVEGKGSPTAEIPRLESEIQIDGKLDEPVWSQATRLTGFWQYQPVDGRPAEEETEVLVWYAPDAIYFGVIAYDKNPAAIRATVADRDNIDNDDYVVLDLDTFHDRRRAFFFAANPLGVQADGVRSEGGAIEVGNFIPGNIDNNPDFTWDSKGRITDRGYQIEIRIPFRSLRYPGSGPQTWGFNVTRVVQRTGYTDTWTDVRRANASFLGQEGALGGLHDMRHGVTIEAQPFVTATADGIRDGVSGRFTREDVDPDAGLNLRLGFSSYALDATINPDFSQVESDEGQVTVNERFALFFPEKRPFFLEGIELFGSPQTLVYTRRIVNPKAGAKLTGKFGQLGVAHLTAVDQTDAGDAWFNITRLRRDFGRNSIAGLTFTNRDQGGNHNRVLAGDFRYVWGLYYVQFQAGGSFTRDAAGSRSAPIWQAEYDRTGRAWGFNYLLTGQGEGFDAQAGFVNQLRSGVVTGRAFNRLTHYGNRGALLENLTVFFGQERVWLYDHFGFKPGLEGNEQLDATFQLRGGWELNGHVQRNFVNFQDSSFAGYTIGSAAGPAYLPPGDFSGFTGEAKVTTPTWRQLGATVSYGRGRAAIFQEGATGRGWELTGSVDLRPASTVRVTALATLFRLFRLDGSEFARSTIPRVKLEYQPNRALFFRVIGEYRSERRAGLLDPSTGDSLFVGGAPQPATEYNGLRLDLLASFEPTPGTVAFLGYGSSMESDSEFNWSRLSRVNDGFFVKLAYQVRR
jgi:uncharacterized protein DUF5916